MCAWWRTDIQTSKSPHRYKGWVGPVSRHAQEGLRGCARRGRLLPAGRRGQRLIGACRSLVLVVPLRECVVHKSIHLGGHVDVLAVTCGHLQRPACQCLEASKHPPSALHQCSGIPLNPEAMHTDANACSSCSPHKVSLTTPVKSDRELPSQACALCRQVRSAARDGDMTHLPCQDGPDAVLAVPHAGARLPIA